MRASVSLRCFLRVLVNCGEGDARDYLINKLESERDDPEKVFTLLTRRFGTGCKFADSLVNEISAPTKMSCSTWMLLSISETKDIPDSRILAGVTKSSNDLSKDSETKTCGNHCRQYMVMKITLIIPLISKKSASLLNSNCESVIPTATKLLWAHRIRIDNDPHLRCLTDRLSHSRM